MNENLKMERLTAARAGDKEAFGELIEPFRRELFVHCYRILGSYDDAEDTLQDVLLCAWQRFPTFEGRGPLRAWLYTIATHTALDAQAGKRLRTLPMTLYGPADPQAPLANATAEALWLSPLPDTLLEGVSVGPEAIYEARESIALAFLAALQQLPGRQRAALLLRDVLGWSTPEVAAMLDMTTAALNSALQRARATMKRFHTISGHDAEPPDARTTVLLERYVRAWESEDPAMLVALLREDAAFSMPPLPCWYRGRAAVGQFLSTHLFAGRIAGEYRLLATRANGCPAFAGYQRDATGVYQPAALHVLTIAERKIAEIYCFIALGPDLFSHFGLPPTN